MNMPFPSRGQVEFTRSCYPAGTRIVLNSMNDPYAPVESGTRGLFGMWTMPGSWELPGIMGAAFR